MSAICLKLSGIPRVRAPLQLPLIPLSSLSLQYWIQHWIQYRVQYRVQCWIQHCGVRSSSQLSNWCSIPSPFLGSVFWHHLLLAPRSDLYKSVFNPFPKNPNKIQIKSKQNPNRFLWALLVIGTSQRDKQKKILERFWKDFGLI